MVNARRVALILVVYAIVTFLTVHFQGSKTHDSSAPDRPFSSPVDGLSD